MQDIGLMFILWVGYFALALLFIGLYRPWYMLWWEPTQTRKRVIYIYGGVALTMFTLYIFLSLLF